MRKFDLPTLAILLSNLERTERQFRDSRQAQGINPINELQQRAMLKLMSDTILFCNSRGYGFTETTAKAFAVDCRIKSAHPLMDCSAIAAEIRGVLDVLTLEITKFQFVQIAADRVGFSEREFLFGEDVFAAFPSADFDIKEAGNCLAVECNVAAVYHAMRAVEFALRAIARDRRISFPKGPVEVQQWGDILRELEKSVAAIQQWPKGMAKEAAHEFYNKALLEIRGFNDAYRRHVMHSRAKRYDRYEAFSVLEKVERFMRLLATKISERKRTPKIWRHP